MTQDTGVPEWMADTDELAIIKDVGKDAGNGTAPVAGDESPTQVVESATEDETRTEVLPPLASEGRWSEAFALPSLEGLSSRTGLLAAGGIALLAALAIIIFGGSGNSQGSSEEAELDIPSVEASSDEESAPAVVEEEPVADEEQASSDQPNQPSGGADPDQGSEPSPPPQSSPEPPGVTPPGGGINP